MPVKAIQLGNLKVCRLLEKTCLTVGFTVTLWVWDHNHNLNKCCWFQYFCQNQRKPVCCPPQRWPDPTVTSCSGRNTRPCPPLCRSSRSSCWPSPSARPPSGTTSAGWHLSRSEREKCQGLNEVVEEGSKGEEELSARAWINLFKYSYFFPALNFFGLICWAV